MNAKKSGAISYLITLKAKLAKRLSAGGKYDSLQDEGMTSIKSDTPSKLHEGDSNENDAAKGILSNMGDKLCLSKWSAFK